MKKFMTLLLCVGLLHQAIMLPAEVQPAMKEQQVFWLWRCGLSSKKQNCSPQDIRRAKQIIAGLSLAVLGALLTGAGIWVKRDWLRRQWSKITTSSSVEISPKEELDQNIEITKSEIDVFKGRLAKNPNDLWSQRKIEHLQNTLEEYQQKREQLK